MSKKIERIIEKVLIGESINAKEVAKILWSPDFDMKNQVWVSGDTLEIATSYWVGAKDAQKKLIDDWTKPTGTYAKYFNDTYGISFELVKTQEYPNAEGKYKKFAGPDAGVIVIFVKVK